MVRSCSFNFFRPLGSAREMVAREEPSRWIRPDLSRALLNRPIGVPESENDRPNVRACGSGVRPFLAYNNPKEYPCIPAGFL